MPGGKLSLKRVAGGVGLGAAACLCLCVLLGMEKQSLVRAETEELYQEAEAEGEQRLVIGDDGVHQALQLDLVGAAALIVGSDGKLGIQLGSAVVDLLPLLVAEYAQGVSLEKI